MPGLRILRRLLQLIHGRNRFIIQRLNLLLPSRIVPRRRGSNSRLRARGAPIDHSAVFGVGHGPRHVEIEDSVGRLLDAGAGGRSERADIRLHIRIRVELAGDRTPLSDVVLGLSDRRSILLDGE